MVRASAVSHPGVRPVNEVSYLCQDDLCLFVVADGTRGHAAGEVASRLAVESIENFVRRSRDGEEYSWPYGIHTRLTLDGNRLRTAIGLANRRLVHESEGHDDDAGMGTTVVSALIAGSRLVVGHVGDSRLYMSEQATDASLKRHPMRNVLTNALGVRDDDRLLMLMTERDSASHTAQTLVDEALAQGANDNVTALVVLYEGEA